MATQLHAMQCEIAQAQKDSPGVSVPAATYLQELCDGCTAWHRGGVQLLTGTTLLDGLLLASWLPASCVLQAAYRALSALQTEHSPDLSLSFCTCASASVSCSGIGRSQKYSAEQQQSHFNVSQSGSVTMVGHRDSSSGLPSSLACRATGMGGGQL